MTSNLIALVAEQHVADLMRSARRHQRIPQPLLSNSGPVVQLRAAHGDDETVRRLAALDDASELVGPALLAVVDGRPVAALALDDGRVVADPFVRSAHAVSLLRLRADHISGVSSRRRPRIRLPRLRLA